MTAVVYVESKSNETIILFFTTVLLPGYAFVFLPCYQRVSEINASSVLKS